MCYKCNGIFLFGNGGFCSKYHFTHLNIIAHTQTHLRPYLQIVLSVYVFSSAICFCFILSAVIPIHIGQCGPNKSPVCPVGCSHSTHWKHRIDIQSTTISSCVCRQHRTGACLWDHIKRWEIVLGHVGLHDGAICSHSSGEGRRKGIFQG